jgi:nucleotide-binding universal stress UspA family protein
MPAIMESIMYRHILIPTDGSDLAQKGVEQGLELAKGLGAKVTAVIATDAYQISGLAVGAGWVPSAEEMAEFNTAQKQFADAIFAAIKASAHDKGVTVETIQIPSSQAAAAILQVAADQGCDLIVMASHGRRGVERVLLGSQTAEVLSHSAISVLVVK